jgi:outer membrane receptor for ferrienterochelin and colicin
VEAARGGFYYNETESASVLPEYYRGRIGFDSALDLGNSEVRFGGSGMLMRRDDLTTAEGAALVLGNPDLKPEYSLGFNAGLEYSKAKGFFQLNLYYNELFNEIGRVFVAAQGASEACYDTRNISRSIRLGTDAEGRISFPQGIFVSSGYNWLFAWDRSTNMEIFPQPNHTVKLKAGLDLAKIGIYTWLQGRYFSKFMEPTRTDSEARFILDFYFSVNLGKHFKFHLGVDNITGEMDRIGPETAQVFSVGIKYGQ